MIEGYDSGGVLPWAAMVLPQSTLSSQHWLSSEQIRVLEAAAVLVERWNARDKDAAQSS